MGLLLNFLKSYWPQIAAFLGAVAVGFGLAWNLQGLKLDAIEMEFGRYGNEVEQNALAAKRAAMDKENFWRQEVENARINAQAREAKLQKDMAAARSALGGLRGDLATLRARLAEAPDDACINTAATLGELLGQCGEDYRALAEVSDRHVNDLKTLSEAWPR